MVMGPASALVSPVELEVPDEAAAALSLLQPPSPEMPALRTSPIANASPMCLARIMQEYYFLLQKQDELVSEELPALARRHMLDFTTAPARRPSILAPPAPARRAARPRVRRPRRSHPRARPPRPVPWPRWAGGWW